MVELGVGTMIGEVAMMDPKATRALSGMAKTDCVFLLLNREAFDILVKVIIYTYINYHDCRRNKRKKMSH